jgi:hypothetical protein
MKSLRLFSLVFLLSFGLNACSESALVATPSLTPDVIPTFTPNPTATFTPTFTPTPEATSTPKYPTIPPEIMEKLPQKWNVVQTDGTWFIVDSAKKTNIYRFPRLSKNWQERYDVTIGEVTYEGWIKDEEKTELVQGKRARPDLIVIDTRSKYSMARFALPGGYVEAYKIFEISDGNDRMEAVQLDMIYFNIGGVDLHVQLAASRKILEKDGFDVTKSLGSSIVIPVSTPLQSQFTDAAINALVENSKLNTLEKDIVMAIDRNWLKAESLVSRLQHPSSTSISLGFDLFVGSLYGVAEPVGE